MPNRLLIGGLGYLGGELFYQATALGWQVDGISQSGQSPSVACNLIDLASLLEFKQSLGGDPAFVIHCASTQKGEQSYQDIYFKAVQNLQKSFPKAVLLMVSSTSVYGQTNGEIVTENSLTQPSSQNSHCLLEAEQLVLDQSGIVVRLAGLYGSKRSVILQNLLNRKPQLATPKDRYLNQIHLQDASSGILTLLQSVDKARGQVYNLVDSTPLLQSACYTKLCQKLKLPVPAVVEKELNPKIRKRPWTHKYVSNQKLRDFGWEPQYASFLEAVDSVGLSLTQD